MTEISDERLREIEAYQPLDFAITHVELTTMAQELLAYREGPGWLDISTARKDGTIIWALLRDNIFPGLLPNRDDLKRWNGLQVPLRHPGVVYTEGGREWDPGWNIAAPVGSGGFPDEWISGWRPLPSGAMT